MSAIVLTLTSAASNVAGFAFKKLNAPAGDINLDYQRDAEHDPKLKATMPKMERMFKEDQRACFGACIPIASAMPLVNRFCEGNSSTAPA
jgi:hypothetical protein